MAGYPLRRPDAEPVLIVSGCEGATQRYRCHHHAEQLWLRGVPVRLVQQGSPNLLSVALGSRIVILHRVAYDPAIAALMRQTWDTAGIVLFDIDDLVFDPEQTHWHHGVTLLSAEEARLYHDGVRRYRQTLLASDGAILATEFLAAEVRKLGKPAWVSRNCVDLELLALSEAARKRARREPDRVVVGFASGSWTHDRDFAEAAGPALWRIMQRRPEVLFRVIGPLQLGPEWDALGERIERQPLVDWRRLPEWLAQLDINLAPLEIDNPFCQAKSELKWLEAAACGVPTVASATEAFATAIEDGVTGLLARNAAEFEAALEWLVDRPAERQAMGQAALEVVRRERSTVGQAAHYEATLQQARAILQPKTAPPAAPCNPSSLQIGVLMPEPARGSGGHTSIVRMIHGLVAAGHKVTAYVDRGPQFRDASVEEIERYLARYFGLAGARVRRDHDFEPSDALIATSWTTATTVAMAANTRCRLYFVQDYEPFFEPTNLGSLLAEATYSLGLGHITLGPWLAELLRARYAARAEAIDFGVDHSVYTPGPAARRPLVVFYGRATTPRRGTELGLAALRLVKEWRPDVEVALYGSPVVGITDEGFSQVGILTATQLAELYRKAAVGLALSYTNLSFVPLEMMACGCAVVVNDCPPVRWFFRHGENALAVPSDAQALARAILSLLDDEALRLRLMAAGQETVASLDWQKSQAQFERLVRNYVAEAGVCHPVIAPSGAGRARPVSADVPGGSHLAPPSANMAAPGRGPRGLAEPPGAGGGTQETVALDLLWLGQDELPLATGVPIVWRLPCQVDDLFRLDLQLVADHLWPAGRLRLTLRAHPSLGPDLAQVTRDLSDFVRFSWLSFEFPALSHSAGRELYACLEWLGPVRPRGLGLVYDSRPQADGAGEPWQLRVGEEMLSGRPALRTFGAAGSHAADRPDWRLWRPLERLRRDRAGLAARQAAFEREAVAPLVRRWRALTRALPPPDRRPWPTDAPLAQKLGGAIRHYGLWPALCEVLAYLRFRRRGRSLEEA